MSFRNPFLNFKPRRRTTLEIVNEIASEVFRTLYLDEEPIGFLEQNDQFDLVEIDYRFFHRDSLAAGHLDRSLQTLLSKEDLDLQLLAIYRKSVEWIEERGINALFLTIGMLEYFEDTSSNVQFHAPLVLLPVELDRLQLGSFRLRAIRDDPFVNPALIRKFQAEFQITLPALPEKFEEFVPEAFLAEIQERISSMPRWNVTNQIYLSFYQFQKFLMYRDLEENEDLYLESAAIQELCGCKEPDPIPEEILNESPDTLLDPANTFHVLDADSSQQRALIAVRTGRNLVIEGPPGTGKSQTIVNLIAEALANRKTVLLVSEKKAALDVVYGRLQTLDLHDFCLELHSNKTTKREVLKQLGQTLEGSSPPKTLDDLVVQHLTHVRNELKLYVRDMHRPFGATALTPFQMLGEIASLPDVPSLNGRIPDAENISGSELLEISQLLKEHAVLLAEVGDPDTHPWNGCAVESLGPLLQQDIITALDKALASFNEMYVQITHLVNIAGVAFPGTLGEIGIICDAAVIIGESTGTDASQLLNPRWDQMPKEAVDLITTVRLFQTLQEKTDQRFRQNLLEENPENLRSLAQRCDRYSRSLMSCISIQFWRDRVFLKNQSTKQVVLRRNEMFEATRDAVECLNAKNYLQINDVAAKDLFKDRWKGGPSNWSDLEDYAAWLIRARAFVVGKYIHEKGITLAAQCGLSIIEVQERISRIRSCLERFKIRLNDFLVTAQYSSPDISDAPDAIIPNLFRILMGLTDMRDTLHAWVAYRANRGLCLRSCAGDLMQKFYEQKLPGTLLEPSFRKQFYRLLFDSTLKARPPLQNFNGRQQEVRIQEFRRYDKLFQSLSQQRLLQTLRSRLKEQINDSSLQNEWNILSRYMQLKRINDPLRRILNKVPNAIRLIKPCFLMSPLSAAQFLNPRMHQFDLVIFDEASQIATEDAIGSIVRAKQVIVVGDSKQLPPTNSFEVPPEEDEAIEGMYEDLESILDQFRAVHENSFFLRWHYRSKHESLITFSNAHFYKTLFTFPHAFASSEELGLHFHKVNGIYEGRGINRIEAEAVVYSIMDHIRSNPDRSLGVATFGIMQMELIKDLVEQARKENSDLEFFFQSHPDEPFFVKNLETIQGDERDTIILSIGYGPDELGQMRYNFGPVNGESGWRRLNVLFTRARYCMKVFSSIRGEDMDISHMHNEGVSLLRDFLLYADKGRMRQEILGSASAESPFEEAVKNALIASGLPVISQAGSSAYRIDLAVVDPEHAGRFLLGIECDGYMYHRAETVRDRDRLREEELQTRGWKILRIWSIDWYANPDAEIARVLAAVESSRNQKVEAKRTLPFYESQTTPAIKDQSWISETKTFRGLNIQEYRPTPINRVGTPESIMEDQAAIKDVLLRVIGMEGPIHVDELHRRVSMHWGITQVTTKVVEMIDQEVEGLCNKDVMIKKGNFLKIKGKAVQPRVYPRTFSADYISPEEILAAIKLVLKMKGSQPVEQLQKEISRLMGLERAGEKLAENISNAIEWMLDNGEARLTSNGIQLTH